MACPAAAYESIFDVATINAERAFIWTAFATTSYMVFVVFAHAVYVSHTIFAIYITDFGPSCGTSPSNRADYAHTSGPGNHYDAYCSTDLHYSFGTHRSTHMAFCSSSIAYNDYSTDTIAELSIPTSPSSPSTIDGSIYGYSR